MFACLYRKSSGGLVEEGYLSEPVADSEGLLDFVIGDDLHHAFFDDEEAHGFGALVEDKGVRADTAVEHFFGYVFNFCLAQVIEDEVVLEAAQQECHFLILLFLLFLFETFFKDNVVEVIVSIAILL